MKKRGEGEPRLISVLFSWHAAVLASNQNYAAQLAADPDLKVTLLVPPRWDESTSMVEAHIPAAAGYRVIVDEVKRPCKGLSFRYRNIRRILTEIQPDVIFLYEEPYSYVALQMVYWQRRICPRARIVFYTWQNLDNRYSLLRRQIEKYVFRHASLAVAGSDDVEAVLRLHGFTGPVRKVPLALDPADFPAADGEPIRKKLGLHEFTLGYVGRLIKEKGLEDLLQALSLITDRPFQLLLVGGGTDEAELMALAGKLGLTPRIVHLPYVKNTEMYRYYPAMDAMILPSRTTAAWKEQFGRILIEAMVCGTPVLCSSSGEIPNVLGDAGLVFAEQNALRLAEALREIMDDSALRSRLSAAGRERVLNHFTWERVAKQTAAVIREVACQK